MYRVEYATPVGKVVAETYWYEEPTVADFTQWWINMAKRYDMDATIINLLGGTVITVYDPLGRRIHV